MSSQPQKRLFIGSLPYRYTEGELLTLFAPFGRIISLKIMHNQWGKSRGIGYVEFDELDSAIKAKEQLHHHELVDRTIIVDYAQPDPFLTPEGQQRHAEALSRHPARVKRLERQSQPQSSASPSRPAAAGRQDIVPRRAPSLRPQDFEHQRPTVYESRHFGSKIGKKFAQKTRAKKK